MDTRRIETLLTVQAMLLALVVHILLETTTYFGQAIDWLVTLFPLLVLFGGTLFLSHRSFEYVTGWLTSGLQTPENR